MNEKISVIIPVYNTEKYLRRCLDSIVGQTFKNLEIICVDDGSTDSSPVILEEYRTKDDRVVVLTQKNNGAGAARNTGLNFAAGEFVTFADSDDWVETNAYETALNAMVNNPVDMVLFSIAVEARDGEDYRTVRFSSPSSGVCAVDNDMLAITPTVVWNKLFKKKIIDKYHLRFPVRRVPEDREFCTKYMVLCRSVFCLHQPLYHYVVSKNTLREAFNHLFYLRPPKKGAALPSWTFVTRNIYAFLNKYGLLSQFAPYISKRFYDSINYELAQVRGVLSKIKVLRAAKMTLSRTDMSIFSGEHADILRQLGGGGGGYLRFLCWGLDENTTLGVFLKRVGKAILSFFKGAVKVVLPEKIIVLLKKLRRRD